MALEEARDTGLGNTVAMKDLDVQAIGFG